MYGMPKRKVEGIQQAQSHTTLGLSLYHAMQVGHQECPRDLGACSRVTDVLVAAQALSEVLPSVAEKKVGKGGFMVLRPDSGDPVEAVLQAVKAAEKVFGADTNAKGFKVMPHICSTFAGSADSDASISHDLRCPWPCFSHIKDFCCTPSIALVCAQVPRGAGVIQGDGINLASLSRILFAVLEAGYSAEVPPALACSILSAIIHPAC
jgi:hypothetical protein